MSGRSHANINLKRLSKMAKQTGHHIVTDSEIAHFNMFRENMKGKICSPKEMIDAIRKKLGWKINRNFLSLLSAEPNAPIIRVNRGSYKVNDSPVYKERLQVVFTKSYEKKKEYRNRAPKQKTELKEAIEDKIAEAIKLLKANGYRIQRIEINYVDV